MRIAFIASEATPFAKTGGLADVAGTLPRFLDQAGAETHLIMPRYRGIETIEKTSIRIRFEGADRSLAVYKKDHALFIDWPPFFDREGLYGTAAGDYADNCERFTLFCKGAVELVKALGADVVHCHDWQTGLIPLYLKTGARRVRTVFTVHNLGYQGRFPASKFPLLELDPGYFTPEGLEFYGDVNFLKAGLVYADEITTVSKTYASEIQQPEFGFGLEGVLRERSENLHGILNGLDYEYWNPATDQLIYRRYAAFQGKQLNKGELAAECNIDPKRPLIGIVSRIAGQKGFDLLNKAFDELLKIGFGLVILGCGEPEYEQRLKRFEETYPQHVSVNLKFDETLAHRIYAGSDFFLMPSRYEPCGLGQLISMRYGTIPIVHRVGGLADTVAEYDPETERGTGFLFTGYSAARLVEACRKAFTTYWRRDLFRRLSEAAMKLDFSWNRSALEYMKLYRKIAG